MVKLTGTQRYGMRLILMEARGKIGLFTVSTDKKTKEIGLEWIKNLQQVRQIFDEFGLLRGELKAIKVESLTNEMKKHIDMVVWFARQNVETAHADYVRKNVEYNPEIVEKIVDETEKRLNYIGEAEKFLDEQRMLIKA